MYTQRGISSLDTLKEWASISCGGWNLGKKDDKEGCDIW